MQLSERNRLINALKVPRTLIQSKIDLGDCPFNGHYVSETDSCRLCTEKFECAWLHSHDEFVALEQKSDEVLIEALEFAIHYVAGNCAMEDHYVSSCGCGHCAWLREARKLFDSL